MNLYKFVSFDNKYWDNPLKTNRLYFSTINDLYSVNDRTEFQIDWNSHSFIFNKYHEHFESHISKLFKISRIFCFSKSMNEHCWKEFSKNNGVCYEFKFSQHLCKDVTHKNINYCDSKMLNLPRYIVLNIKNTRLKQILGKPFPLEQLELLFLKENFESDDIKNTFENFILEEIVFKKTKQKYIKEDEYRFVHIQDSIGPVTPQNKFDKNFTLTMEELGLEIVCIHTSNPAHVKERFPQIQIPIKMINPFNK